jgi:hypothetical protein
MSKNKLVGVLLVCILLRSAVVTCQGALVKMDISDLWCEADVVLIGDVLNITTHQGEEGFIYRNVVVGVVRYNKNPLNLPRVDVHVLGGVIGDIGHWVEDQPEFEIGETVLVFLRHHPEEHPNYPAEGYHVVNGPIGKFTVTDRAAKNIASETLELTDSLGLPAIFVASDLCIHQWGEFAENVNITFTVTNVGEEPGYFNASFFYQDPALEGAGAGGYNIMDVYLEAGESWTVSASDIFVAELPGVYEVEADTELHRKDYRNPLTMSFEVLETKPSEAVTVGLPLLGLEVLPEVLLVTILAGFLLIIIIGLLCKRRAIAADG